MRYWILLIILLMACDPSYKSIQPDLTEESFRAMSAADKLDTYDELAPYIDRPAYLNLIIAEDQEVVALILDHIKSDMESHKKSNRLYLLLDIQTIAGDVDVVYAAEVLKAAYEQETDESIRETMEYVMLQLLPPDCCNECIEAFTTSQDAVGQENAMCGNFNTAHAYSGACTLYFEQNTFTVEECAR